MKMLHEMHVTSTVADNRSMKKGDFVGSSWEWTLGFGK